MLKDLKTDIQELVTPLLEREGFDLVEIKLSRYKKDYRLQIFVDSDAGVTLGQCALLSRLVGTALDAGDVMDSRYILEISSPGLDRPLHNDRDFRRRIGENMAVEILRQGRKRTVTGTLTGVEESVIVLSGKDGEFKIPLADIQQGRIII